MNQQERVDYHRTTEEYFEKNQIKDLFSHMSKEALKHMPDDPLEFFIDLLKSRTIKKVICVVGNDAAINDKICNMICNDFLYQQINVQEDVITTALGQKPSNSYDEYLEILKAKSEKKGFIFNNFPNNVNQALWMSRNNIVPERVFLLTSPDGQIFNSKKVSGSHLMESTEVRKLGLHVENIASINYDIIRDFYRDVIYDIPLEYVNSDTDEMTVFKVVRNIMTIRYREITPKRPPRIIFMGYPSKFLNFLNNSLEEIQNRR